MGFAHAHVAEWVAAPEFQRPLGVIAAALMEHGSMDGELVMELLRRDQIVHKHDVSTTEGT